MEKEHTAVDASGVDDYQYVIAAHRRSLSIERNFAADDSNWNKPRTETHDGGFYISVKNGHTAASIALTDEEMQELFYAYLALRKDYEDAQG